MVFPGPLRFSHARHQQGGGPKGTSCVATTSSTFLINQTNTQTKVPKSGKATSLPRALRNEAPRSVCLRIDRERERESNKNIKGNSSYLCGSPSNCTHECHPSTPDRMPLPAHPTAVVMADPRPQALLDNEKDRWYNRPHPILIHPPPMPR
ncbi:unnamed protein product [Ectocarpus sp. 12 AP-2014]